MSKIKILDACCGSRMFWFDKNESHTIFMDIRQETFEIHGKKVNVDPDVIGDFRDMPFEDNNNYDYPLQKPTKFASNLDLGLKNDIIKQEIEWNKFSKSYNERSNIPQNLVIEIFTKVYNEFLQEKEHGK